MTLSMSSRPPSRDPDSAALVLRDAVGRLSPYLCHLRLWVPARRPGRHEGSRAAYPNFRQQQTQLHDLAASLARGIHLFLALQSKGAGNAGRSMHPQPRVQNKNKYTSVVTTGHTGITRHSPRNGFNGYSVLAPAYRAF